MRSSATSARATAAAPLLAQDEILQGPTKADSVKAWYDEFGQNIDGIYFDELILPDYQCYVLANAAPVTWQDVPTSVYIDQL